MCPGHGLIIRETQLCLLSTFCIKCHLLLLVDMDGQWWDHGSWHGEPTPMSMVGLHLCDVSVQLSEVSISKETKHTVVIAVVTLSNQSHGNRPKTESV